MNYAVLAFIIGAILFVVEIFSLSFFMFFFGIGAWAAALYLAFADNLNIALAIFSISSIASLIFLRKLLIQTFHGSSKNPTNQGPEFMYTGKQAVVSKDIPANNFGEIDLGASFWRATATVDIKKGEKVIVLGQVENDEISLRVKAID